MNEEEKTREELKEEWLNEIEYQPIKDIDGTLERMQKFMLLPTREDVIEWLLHLYRDLLDETGYLYEHIFGEEEDEKG